MVIRGLQWLREMIPTDWLIVSAITALVLYLLGERRRIADKGRRLVSRARAQWQTRAVGDTLVAAGTQRPTAQLNTAPDEVTRKRAALNQLSDCVTTAMESVQSGGADLRDRAWAAFGSREPYETYERAMDAYIRDVRSTAAELNRLRDRTDYADLVRLTDPIRSAALEEAATKFKHRLVRLMRSETKADTPADFREMMEPRVSEFDVAHRAFVEWRDSTRRELAAIRGNLSQ